MEEATGFTHGFCFAESTHYDLCRNGDEYEYLAKHTGEYKGLILLGSYSTADLSATELEVLFRYTEAKIR